MRITSVPWSIFVEAAALPVYATPFTASMLKSKLGEAGLLQDFPLHVVPLGHRYKTARSTLSSLPCRTRSLSRPRS